MAASKTAKTNDNGESYDKQYVVVSGVNTYCNVRTTVTEKKKKREIVGSESYYVNYFLY